MDYEKAYKDICQQLMSAYDTTSFIEVRKAIEKIHPELKESEDERIRKKINNLYSEIDTCISELLKARTDKDAEMASKALFKMERLMVGTLQGLSCIKDYLEKQKEQQPIPKFKVGDRIYDRRDSYNRNVIREVGKDYYINAFAQKMVDMAYTDANFEFLEHLDNEPTDSKPAEWSEEDKCTLNGILADYKSMNATYRHWLEALPERFTLQPKQEWNEEDKNFINHCADLLDGCGQPMCAIRLKELCPQPH